MTLSFTPFTSLSMIQPGDNLAEMIIDAKPATMGDWLEGDLLVIAQKVISKAEGRYVRLTDVTPSPEAIELAKEVDKDPRFVELVLQESVRVVRKRPGVLIVEHKLGFVHANAGIDRSNIEHSESQVLLLPQDPDSSAQKLSTELSNLVGINLPIIINDSMGRAWRNGTLGLAIGVSGLTPLVSHIGEKDIYGRSLEVTEVAVADELAAAASLVMGQTTAKIPVVLVRGFRAHQTDRASTRMLIRDAESDLFR
ncbi:MAG TPA: coenzyme F420-0:L-glutamate ligase [Gammaproteobacteria bacterium]|nr:coenzyme F420-0:L-glutamate ligase [Gammaproteobacteria bacterium]